jgi:hypothetical protein
MLPIIDFRNGRYQGLVSNGLPDGPGIFMDRNFTLCIAEWKNGQINGYSLVAFANGNIFCG